MRTASLQDNSRPEASTEQVSRAKARKAERRALRNGNSVPLNSIWYRNPWKWFFSLRVGIVLLTILTFASIAGTMIAPLERAQAVVFYTWWYKLLLLGLAVNMSCATVMTVIQKLLPSRIINVHQKRGFYETAQLAEKRDFAGGIEDVATAFKRAGFHVRTDGSAGAARSGWYGRLGGPVSHAGLVIVLLAGFASSWVAKEGVVQIPEGASTNTMTLRGGDDQQQVPLGFTLTVNDFATGYFPRTRIPSHFTSDITAASATGHLFSGIVEVNDSPNINGWYVHQTSYQELERLVRHEVDVVAPGSEKPIRVEASPGQKLAIPGVSGATLEFDKMMKWTVRGDDGATIAGGGVQGHAHGSTLSLVADRYEPDFVLGADRQITSRTQEPNNPALRVTLLSDGAPAARQWLFSREDMKSFSHSSDNHFSMELVEVTSENGAAKFTVEVGDGHSGASIGRVTVALGEEVTLSSAEEPTKAATPAVETGWNVTVGKRVPAYATVLTLTRNPAIPIIYGGCLLMMVGLVLGFFIRRRDVWFLVDAENRCLHIAAHYRHPAERLDGATRAALAVLERPAGVAEPALQGVTS